MNSIAIADRLWFEETLLGATLNYQASSEPNGVLFRVGISFKSLQDCDSALGQHACAWSIRDGSLCVKGDLEELTLRFCSVSGEPIQGNLALHGEELKIFRYAVNALASRQRVGLN